MELGREGKTEISPNHHQLPLGKVEYVSSLVDYYKTEGNECIYTAQG